MARVPAPAVQAAGTFACGGMCCSEVPGAWTRRPRPGRRLWESRCTTQDRVKARGNRPGSPKAQGSRSGQEGNPWGENQRGWEASWFAKACNVLAPSAG